MKLYIRLFAFLKPYRLQWIAAFACGITVALLTATYPMLIKPLLDDVFIRKDRSMLIILPPAIMAVALLRGFAAYGEGCLLKYIGNKVVNDIRVGLYRHLVHLPIRYHARNATGNLMSYLINDVNLMQSAVSTVLKDIVRQTLTLIALGSVIFYQNFRLALLATIVIPVFIVPLARLSTRLRRFSLLGQENLAGLAAHLQETLAGIRVVKAFGKETFEGDRFDKKNRAYFQILMKAVRISEIAPPLMESCGAIGVAMIIGYAGLQVINNTLTPGAFFSFITAASLMYGPLKILSSANNTLQQALAATERVFALWDQENETVRDTGKKRLTSVRGEIAFQNVSFYYNPTASPALKALNFNVKAGTTIALVGHSGAGKSTLVHLLPRFDEPTEGVILLDGVPLPKIALSSLRSHFGIVSQETILFDETIGWNIAYGAENASREEMIHAAEAAYAHTFISKMPNGYDTLIEKGGSNLSGGERQRLAIARALLKNPPILILDEATSALDSESEFFVQKALQNLMKNRTTFVIAHRLSTVVGADVIIVLEQGRIIEMGTHNELIQNNGPYKRTYLMQFEGKQTVLAGENRS